MVWNVKFGTKSLTFPMLYFTGFVFATQEIPYAFLRTDAYDGDTFKQHCM